MPRVFTISFHFRGKDHHAFVRMRSTREQYFFEVNTSDREIQQLLPSDTIQYGGREGARNINYSNPLTSELITAISAAIEEHIDLNEID